MKIYDKFAAEIRGENMVTQGERDMRSIEEARQILAIHKMLEDANLVPPDSIEAIPTSAVRGGANHAYKFRVQLVRRINPHEGGNYLPIIEGTAAEIIRLVDLLGVVPTEGDSE